MLTKNCCRIGSMARLCVKGLVPAPTRAASAFSSSSSSVPTSSSRSSLPFFSPLSDESLFQLGWSLPSSFDITPTIKLDIYETPDKYHIDAELPGIEKKDVKVSVNEGIITISKAKTKEIDETGKTPSGVTYRKIERSNEEANRSFRLPVDADLSMAKAKLSEGILSIYVPRRPAPKNQSVQVPIE